LTTSPTYTDREIRVRDVTLHYQEWGDASLPTVLMLHGFGVSGHMFDEFAARAQGMYHLVAVDQRGHGDSDWAPDGDYSRDAFIADVEALRQALELESFLLMGHSMGGLNAATYTAKYPARVQSLVLVDVGPEAAKEGVDNIMRFTQAPAELEFEQFVENAMRFNTRRTRENIEERMRHRLKQLPSGKWTWKFDNRFRDKESGLRIGSEATNEEVWGLFKSIRCPVLLVRGEQSDVLSQEVAERCAAELTNCKLVVVPGAGHSVPGDNPDGFTEPVLEFLESTAHPNFGAGEVPIPPGLEDGPTLDELVEYNTSSRKRPGALTFLAVGAGAVVAVGALQMARKNKQKKRARAEAEAAAAESHPVIDLDEARMRAAHLASDLSELAKSSATKARTRLSDIEVEQARDNAVEIARVLGRTSESAFRSAATNPKTQAARRQSVKAAKSGSSRSVKALRWAGRIAAMAVISGIGKGKKKAHELEAPKRKSLPWRG
jgi:esterase